MAVGSSPNPCLEQVAQEGAGNRHRPAGQTERRPRDRKPQFDTFAPTIATGRNEELAINRTGTVPRRNS